MFHGKLLGVHQMKTLLGENPLRFAAKDEKDLVFITIILLFIF
jgi:hypothetical protein